MIYKLIQLAQKIQTAKDLHQADMVLAMTGGCEQGGRSKLAPKSSEYAGKYN